MIEKIEECKYIPENVSTTKLMEQVIALICLFLTNLVVNKNKSKRNFADNQFHNILRLFDVLPNFPFTTSETIGDYYL